MIRRLAEERRCDIEYNGDTGGHQGVLLYDYPAITFGKRNYEIYQVPGRNGEPVSADDYLSNASISCTFSVFHESFMPKIRDIRMWLRRSGELTLSDSPDVFYEVLKVECGDIERELRTFGRFTVNFLVHPYEFRKDGKVPRNALDYNPYDRCMPLYRITGEGTCALKVNGKMMTANVGQNLSIDSRRMIAYREDGEMMNTKVSGDYEGLWLPSGDCDISVTAGFGLSITPRWGYDL